MPEPKTEVIRGVLRRPRFHNQNNGFAILNVEIPDNILGEDFLSTITCKGILPSVRQNEEYQFTGQWVNDPKWGMQFQFTKAEVILPKTEDGAVRYLSTIAAGPSSSARARSHPGSQGRSPVRVDGRHRRDARVPRPGPPSLGRAAHRDHFPNADDAIRPADDRGSLRDRPESALCG
jgi:hypothetical protein